MIRFDDSENEALYPFTATRNAADIRVGILTIREKWELIQRRLNLIDPDFAVRPDVVPTLQSAAAILAAGDKLPAESLHDFRILHHPWQIFEYNDWALRYDFELITEGRTSQHLPASNRVIGEHPIFIEAGAGIEHCFLNTTQGPIYLGRNAVVQENSMIRGPFALCEGATIKMGARIYGATTIGPFCVATGEIKNSVLFGYTNKGHEGYLGDSVLGEWCNLGAGTSNSNVMNTAGTVKVWNQLEKSFTPVGLKCGLLMGDYSRAAINTRFNTGTVVGVGCNVFTSQFPPKLVPDFSWGEEKYIFEKLLHDIDNWKKLKGKRISGTETIMLQQLYNHSLYK